MMVGMSSDGHAPAGVPAGYAGRRERVLDEHMYRLPPATAFTATFRLQLFTAPGQRPVAVATQVMGEGATLINAAEACATAVWHQFFPADAEPPIWVQRFLSEAGEKPLAIALVTFVVGLGEHPLSSPTWRKIRDEDIDTLIGQPVDRSRGSGFVPPEPEPIREVHYDTALVALLPQPRPFRETACMSAGVPWWRRIGRQLIPRRGPRSCCWYHGGDWRTVSAVAIRLVRQAQAAGVAHDELEAFLMGHADFEKLSAWEQAALWSLLFDTIRPYKPWPFRDGYNNGQHRAQAMIDAGVRRTLVERD